MIEVTNRIMAYEVDDKPTKVGDADAVIEVRSHSIESSMVVLVICGKRMKFKGEDIEAAIRNATNTARF